MAYISTAEAAARLGVAPVTLRVQAKKGILHPKQLSARKLLFDEDEIERYRTERQGKQSASREGAYPTSSIGTSGVLGKTTDRMLAYYQDHAVRQIADVIGRWEEVTQDRQADDVAAIPEIERQEILARAMAVLQRVTPANTWYDNRLNSLSFDVTPSDIPTLIGLLRALRADYVGGFLQTVVETVHAEIFADLLEMAENLLGSESAAAVIIAWGVLEEHLGKLALKYRVASVVATHTSARPRTGVAMNNDLRGAGIYSEHDAKNIAEWATLRNAAVHSGEALASDRVESMLQGVRDFVARFPA